MLPFYSCEGAAGARPWRQRMRHYGDGGAWARVQRCSWHHGGPNARHGEDGGGRRRAGGRHVLADPWRRMATVASPTALERVNGVVWAVAGGVVMA